MQQPFISKRYRFLKPAIHGALGLIICWGLLLVLAQIKPFWMDEWRLLYSLKFKTTASLFGPLDFTQQFPRVYLAVLKGFTSAFDYSYFTLRFPAFITGVCSILLGYRLMNKIYGTVRPERFLFLLIIVASPTFLKYFVQIKQYEMEIFLSLAAIWQLCCLSEIGQGKFPARLRYAGICLSFFLAPFFSYTYPIVVAPVFLMVLISGIRLIRSEMPFANAKKILLLQALPLVLCMLSIAAFYVIDVSRVLQDAGMSCYWQGNMLNEHTNVIVSFLRNIWDFFGSAGSGAVFKILFSLLGLAAFILALVKAGRSFLQPERDLNELIVRYATVLIVVVILLFISGKLPLGEARLNAFTFPSIAVLILYLLRQLRSFKAIKLSHAVSMLLFAGLLGNVISTVIHTFTNQNYAKAVQIYSNTEDAIIFAQAHHLPIVISPEVAYPDDIVRDIPCLDPIDAASVLKTFPAYKEKYRIPVYSSNSAHIADRSELPKGVGDVMVGDGIHYEVIQRSRAQ